MIAEESGDLRLHWLPEFFFKGNILSLNEGLIFLHLYVPENASVLMSLLITKASLRR